VESLMAKRKEIMLGVLLVLLVVVFWKTMTGDGTVIGSGSRLYGAGGRVDYAAKKLFPVPWNLLTSARPTYDPEGRNIFQFGAPPPPPPRQISQAEQNTIDDARRRAEQARLEAMNRAKAPPPQAAPPPPPPQQTTPPPPAEPPAPTPPPINYKFIGYLGPPQNKIAVLHDGTEMVFVSSGDELDEKFRILDIGYESIKFGFLDPQFKSESRTLPMTSTP